MYKRQILNNKVLFPPPGIGIRRVGNANNFRGLYINNPFITQYQIIIEFGGEDIEYEGSVYLSFFMKQFYILLVDLCSGIILFVLGFTPLVSQTLSNKVFMVCFLFLYISAIILDTICFMLIISFCWYMMHFSTETLGLLQQHNLSYILWVALWHLFLWGLKDYKLNVWILQVLFLNHIMLTFIW